MSTGRLSIAEAAAALGVSEKTIRRRIKDGTLPAEKTPGPYGQQYWVSMDSVQTAQQVLDVVKVERPADARTLALAVATEMQRQQAALAKQNAALLAELAEAAERDRALLEELAAIRVELAALREAMPSPTPQGPADLGIAGNVPDVGKTGVDQPWWRRWRR